MMSRSLLFHSFWCGFALSALFKTVPASDVFGIVLDVACIAANVYVIWSELRKAPPPPEAPDKPLDPYARRG